MKKLLVITESSLELEEKLVRVLKIDFDYRVHSFNDLMSDMMKVLRVPKEETMSIRDSLLLWADSTPRHRVRMLDALYLRVRPLARIGRNMCVIGVRDSDLELLRARAQQDRIELAVIRATYQFDMFPRKGEVRVPPQLLAGDECKAHVRESLVTLGLL